MSKVRELRGLIYSKYDSEAQFADVLQWPRQKLSKITNGTKEPDLTELNVLASGLDITVETLAQIFLRHKSPNGQHGEKFSA